MLQSKEEVFMEFQILAGRVSSTCSTSGIFTAILLFVLYNFTDPTSKLEICQCLFLSLSFVCFFLATVLAYIVSLSITHFREGRVREAWKRSASLYSASVFFLFSGLFSVMIGLAFRLIVIFKNQTSFAVVVWSITVVTFGIIIFFSLLQKRDKF